MKWLALLFLASCTYQRDIYIERDRDIFIERRINELLENILEMREEIHGCRTTSHDDTETNRRNDEGFSHRWPSKDERYLHRQDPKE